MHASTDTSSDRARLHTDANYLVSVHPTSNIDNRPNRSRQTIGYRDTAAARRESRRRHASEHVRRGRPVVRCEMTRPQEAHSCPAGGEYRPVAPTTEPLPVNRSCSSSVGS